MKHPLLRLKWFLSAHLAYVNPHGIWLAVHPGMAGGSGLECTTLLEKGTIALPVGEYMPQKRVYLAGGMPVIIDDQDLEQAK